MKLLNFTLIKLAFCLIIGILITRLFPVELFSSIIITITLLVITTSFYFIAKRKNNKTVWFGLSSFLTTISIGVLAINVSNPKLSASHYSHYISGEEPNYSHFTFRVNSVLKSNTFSDRYYVDILKVNKQLTKGKVLLNIKKDSTTIPFNVDAVFMASATIEAIKPSLNPGQFNYKNYLENKHIYHQAYATNEELFRVSENTSTIAGYTHKLRQTINRKLEAYNFTKDELAIINALLLGQRQEVSKSLQNQYANAGAIHILAVSGLHVGIILLILNFVFKPLERFKQGKFFKAFLIVFLLWSYAFLAGNSASIIRATTMFSIVAIGMNLKRPTNIYNTLAISVFVILLFKPNFLFDVGFQLSYSAVLGIVSFQPIFAKYWRPKWKITQLFWNTFTVTIATQIGIIPVSLFYFHQFPGLFWLSNLVVIPLLGIILGLGIIVIVLALANLLPSFIAISFGFVISTMNSFFKWVASKEQFLFEDIAFNGFQLLSAYLVILAIYQLYFKRNFKWASLSLLSVILLQSGYVYNKFYNTNNAFTIIHKSRYTVLIDKHNANLNVFSNLETPQENTSVKNYILDNNIKTTSTDAVFSIHKIDNKMLLVIDSLGVYNYKFFKPSYVLLTASPKLNLTRLIDTVKPDYIIADGSNYKSYIKRWKATCRDKKIPFHYTGEKGAFIIPY